MVGRIAFLFPGQGSQSIGMGQNLLAKSDKARELYSKANSIVGFNLTKKMEEGPEDALKDTAVAQPALFLASLMAAQVMNEMGIKPDYMAGHSLGEYSALAASGALSFERGLALVKDRGIAMKEAGKSGNGSMAAIMGLSPKKVEALCKSLSTSDNPVVAANFNSASQTVISGTKQAIEKAMTKAKEAGALKVIPLSVSGAFHSPLMSSAVSIMTPKINSTPFSNSHVPVITNVDAEPTHQADDFKAKLIKQIDHSVLWLDTMGKLIKEGVETFIEVGSGRVLGTMMKKFDRKKKVFWSDELDAIKKIFITID